MSLRLWPYFVEPLRGRRGAALLSVLAISLGVALGMAVNAVNRAALAEFAEGMRTVSGQADLEVQGPRGGFDEMLYPQLAKLSDVAVASPVVEVEARVPGRDQREQPLKVIGLDIFRAAQLQRRFAVEGQEGGAANDGGMGAFDSDSILLSPAAAAWLGVSVGEKVTLQSGLRPVTLKVAGLLPGVGTSQRLGAMDIAAAQWRFERLGSLNRVSLRFAPGVDPAAAEKRIAALLPPGVVAQRPEEAEGKQADLSRAYRVNLNMLAMIALMTGAFLVLSAQSLAVVRRRSELAFLRAAGATRSMVVAWLVGEGAVIGALGGVIGIGLGYGLAYAVLSAFGGDLGAGYFSGLRPSLRPDWLSAALFLTLGVLAGAAGAFVPALEAASAPPARALKAGDDARMLARLDGFWPGVGCLVAGFALAFLPPLGGLPVFGYASIALMLVGAILLLPRLAKHLFAWLPERGGAALQIAQAQLKSAPGAAAVAGAGILASVAVAVAMAIMVSSFRVSLSDWLEQVLPADLYA
ncbi:MAG: FtsX-like permease family protein, partial [Rhodocyclaceae bacterium]